MFIHLGSRKVFVSPSTFVPTDQWTQQQARNLTLWLDDQGIDLRFLLHDRDTKFCESFDRVFKAAGVKVVRSPIQSPIANCYAESWIGTLKRECLNHFFCFSLRHLDYIVQTYVRYYNTLGPTSRGAICRWTMRTHHRRPRPRLWTSAPRNHPQESRKTPSNVSNISPTTSQQSCKEPPVQSY